MVSYPIRYLANITQNKLQLLRILKLFTECDYAEKVKRYDSFISLGLSFLKSFKINLGSKGLRLLVQYNFPLFHRMLTRLFLPQLSL